MPERDEAEALVERYRGMLADIEAENAQLLAEVKRLRTNCEAFISGRESQRARADRAEHERDAARDELAKMERALVADWQSDRSRRLERERDEARAALAAVREMCDDADASHRQIWDEMDTKRPYPGNPWMSVDRVSDVLAAAGVPEPPQATCSECKHSFGEHDQHGCTVDVGTDRRVYERCHGLLPQEPQPRRKLCDRPMLGIYGVESLCARPVGHTGGHDSVYRPAPLPVGERITDSEDPT